MTDIFFSFQILKYLGPLERGAKGSMPALSSRCEDRLMHTAAVPVIETDRLILREHRLADFDPITVHWESDRTRWTGGPHNRKRAWEVFSMDCAQWHLSGYGMWILQDKASGTTAGWVGFYEAATTAHAYGAEHWDIHAPCSYISTPNARSIALAERMGAVKDKSAPPSTATTRSTATTPRIASRAANRPMGSR